MYSIFLFRVFSLKKMKPPKIDGPQLTNITRKEENISDTKPQVIPPTVR